MGLATENDYRWIGISGTLAVIGVLAWLFLQGESNEAKQALNGKFGVASEQNPAAKTFANDAQAGTN